MPPSDPHQLRRRMNRAFYLLGVVLVFALAGPLLWFSRAQQTRGNDDFAALLALTAENLTHVDTQEDPGGLKRILERTAALPQIELIALYRAGQTPDLLACPNRRVLRDLEPLWSTRPALTADVSIFRPQRPRAPNFQYALRPLPADPFFEDPAALLFVRTAPWNPWRSPTDLVLFVLTAGLLVLLLLRAARRWLDRHLTHPLSRLLHIAQQVQATGETAAGPATADGRSAIDNLERYLTDSERLKREAAELKRTLDRRLDTETRELARQLRAAFQLVSTDPLTGLGNRRALEDNMQSLVDHCRQAGVNLALIAIDIDDFKQLNDNCGHRAGDELLIFFGQLVNGCLREEDIAIRLGGDEFLLILPTTEAAAAAHIARRLNTLFSQHCRLLKVDPTPSLSCGVIDLRSSPTQQAEELLKLADQTLYAAKQRGGGQVSIYPPTAEQRRPPTSDATPAER